MLVGVVYDCLASRSAGIAHATGNTDTLSCEEYQSYLLTHQLTPYGPVPTAFDPNGVYPYISYCETSNRPVLKKYRFVVLQNRYMKVTIPKGKVLSHSSVIDTIIWEAEGPRNESDIKEMTGYFWKTKDVNAFGAYTPSLGSGLYHVADAELELQPNETKWHLEYWFPADTPGLR